MEPYPYSPILKTMESMESCRKYNGNVISSQAHQLHVRHVGAGAWHPGAETWLCSQCWAAEDIPAANQDSWSMLLEHTGTRCYIL